MHRKGLFEKVSLKVLKVEGRGVTMGIDGREKWTESRRTSKGEEYSTSLFLQFHPSHCRILYASSCYMIFAVFPFSENILQLHWYWIWPDNLLVPMECQWIRFYQRFSMCLWFSLTSGAPAICHGKNISQLAVSLRIKSIQNMTLSQSRAVQLTLRPLSKQKKCLL